MASLLVLTTILFLLSYKAYAYGICNSNNCLRGMRGKSATAATFCSAYTAGQYTGPLPTYAAACSTTGISSACSCLSSATSTVLSTPTACSVSTVFVTQTAAPSRCRVGPLCGPINGDFEEGMCSWQGIDGSTNLGSTVSVAADGSFFAFGASNMWSSAGSPGIQQAIRLCKTEACAFSGLSRVLTEEECTYTVCIIKNINDPQGYICNERQISRTSVEWQSWGFPLRTPTFDPVGEIWMFTIKTDCPDLYMDEVFVQCH